MAAILEREEIWVTGASGGSAEATMTSVRNAKESKANQARVSRAIGGIEAILEIWASVEISATSEMSSFYCSASVKRTCCVALAAMEA